MNEYEKKIVKYRKHMLQYIADGLNIWDDREMFNVAKQAVEAAP
jgi:hypothetical protein